jgi:anaerobic magnesium-protoporphyrin IX monomethyl ester cyclase
MSDILFANTYFLKHDLKEFRNMNLYAPLGTLYAAAYVMQKGYSAALFDTMLADSEEDLKASLEQHKPKYMVIYDDTFNYLTKMCLTRMREAAFRMSEIAKEFGCTVIVSGSDSVDHLEKYFQHKVDYAICGEGEQTLGELLDYMKDNFASSEAARQSHEQSQLHNINGLAFIENGKITRTAPRKVLKELDTLPYPAWELG